MKTLTYKILESHLVDGTLAQGNQIGIHIDQTLTQDATGTMAYLQLEAMGIDKVKTELSVSYVDHNTLQDGFENADDHRFLQTTADKHGIYYSKAGNGICHQVHLERFAKPGRTLLGSDSHTPTSSAMGMLAIGAGGLDVACAMAGRPFYLTCPKVVKIELINSLNHGVSAKDIILKVLQLLSVKGGVGRVLEYVGEGVKSLSIPERSTITNMGAELGATSSIFPSDEVTLEFLKRQQRESDFIPLQADDSAEYDESYTIDLSSLKPMIALPHSPDNVKEIQEVVGKKVNQIAIGSCTNSSYTDLLTVSTILKGKKIHKDVSLVISFGSKQVFSMLSKNGALTDIIDSGARILEATCGPCIGMGQSPCTDAVSLRTFNRNFLGRSGTKSAGVYLVSPEVAAVSALTGVISDPSEFKYEKGQMPKMYHIDDSMIIKPTFTSEIVYGPNIKPLPKAKPLPNTFTKKVIIKVEDNITTDHIMPAGAKVLPYRSNIEKISEFVFSQVDSNFYANCIKEQGGVIVARENYGQGSSREHAALAPMYLGIQAVIAMSYARIHRQNLINFGILPLLFNSIEDYNQIYQMDKLEFVDLEKLTVNCAIKVYNKTKENHILLKHDLTAQEISILKAGGLLNTMQSK